MQHCEEDEEEQEEAEEEEQEEEEEEEDPAGAYARLQAKLAVQYAKERAAYKLGLSKRKYARAPFL